MRQIPDYFERVRLDARRRWDQLEADPDLAGPWRQLFNQVRSPRHVLSELLQNADDAGATWAAARLDGDVLIFEHNGADFNQDSLRSLCSFAFSNKRQLHTIGFRGIGFKSTFSLGPTVEVHTPTLAFAFHERRFTEPVWLPTAAGATHTSIRVRIDHREKVGQIERELARWSESPITLLFFTSITTLRIGDETISREPDGTGPVTGPEWVRLIGRSAQRVLHIRSGEEHFPPEALAEVREERGNSTFNLPPCRVEVVFGAGGTQRLYAVLPTDAVLPAPFSVNAPFMQDPGRTGVKHPSASPTNRWLLERAGRLVANTISEWLKASTLSLRDRAAAYDLLPDPVTSDGSAAQEAAKLLVETTAQSLKATRHLLTEGGLLSTKDQCLVVPHAIDRVWDGATTIRLFGAGKRFMLAREVSAEARTRLHKWAWIDLLSPSDLATSIAAWKAPPRPESLDRLLDLWRFIESDLLQAHYFIRGGAKQWHIVPAQGSTVLHSPEDVLVLGGKSPAITEEDWKFLQSRVLLVEPEWTQLLADGARTTSSDDAAANAVDQRLEPARSLFRWLDLNQRVGIQQVVEAVAARHEKSNPPEGGGLRLPHIAARADVIVPSTFPYLCGDLQWRPADGLLVTGAASTGVLPDAWLESRVISSRYEADLSDEEMIRWRKWSGDQTKSRLRGFPLPTEKTESLYGKQKVGALCVRRGGYQPASFRLASTHFQVADHDFDEELWAYWASQASADPPFWTLVAKAFLAGWSDDWKKVSTSEVRQLGSTYYYQVDHGQLTAAWLMRLRSLPCLPDTYDRMHVPAELLRLTPETAPLQDVEPFLHPAFDRSEYQEALDLLGVRSEPAGTGKLVDRLRALAGVSQPPLSGLISLYRALDRVSIRLPPEELATLRGVFSREKLIFTEQGEWHEAGAVFQENAEALPGASTVIAATRDLLLWDRLEVAKHPTLDLALRWLSSLRRGEPVRGGDRERVRYILRRAPEQVWQTSSAWLDAAARWSDVSDLRWSIRRPDGAAGLFEGTRRTVADLSMLENTPDEHDCFRGLQSLESAIESRIVHFTSLAQPRQLEWLAALGGGLQRIAIPDGDAEDQPAVQAVLADQAMARHLSQSRWQSVSDLRVAPYLLSEQVGPERNQKVVWHEGMLYAEGSAPTHHKELVSEVSRRFRTLNVRDAIGACIDRDAKWIKSYLEEHLTLVPDAATPPAHTTEMDNGVTATLDEERFKADPADQAVSGVTDGEVDRDGDVEDESGTDVTGVPDATPPLTVRLSANARFRQYLASIGFSWDQYANRFIHPSSGHAIQKLHDLPLWEMIDRSSNGDALYWLGKGSLEVGVEIPADVWHRFQTFDGDAWLVLPEGDSEIVLHRWADIAQRLKAQECESYASRYVVRLTAPPVLA